MRFLLTALGSYGDVHPMVGLGAALVGRGHQAAIITNPHFQSVVEAAGVEFIPLGTAEEYDELARHPELWHSIRGPMLVLRSAMAGLLRPIYELIDTHYQPGETVLVAHALDLASRVYQEKNNAPMASVHFAPLAMRSFYDSSSMFGMWMSPWLPRWFRRSQYWLADKVVDHLVAGELNRFRQELGLAPVKRVIHQWFYSPQLVLGLFPEWFAAPQPDWPANVRLTGFPLWDQSSTKGLPQKVAEFLSGGRPPIVFAPGSAMTEGENFFSAAVMACEKLEERGILLTRYPEQLPKKLPEGVRHFDFVPFSQLLPRASALVHHGGIGTSAQGLAAGLPQLVMPMAYDQLDNATRLERLGVGRILRRRRFTGANLALALFMLLKDNSVHTACHHWAQQSDTEASLQLACEALEGI